MSTFVAAIISSILSCKVLFGRKSGQQGNYRIELVNTNVTIVKNLEVGQGWPTFSYIFKIIVTVGFDFGRGKLIKFLTSDVTTNKQ